jgi:hypothetical protein
MTDSTQSKLPACNITHRIGIDPCDVDPKARGGPESVSISPHAKASATVLSVGMISLRILAL